MRIPPNLVPAAKSHPMAQALKESYEAAFRGDPKPMEALFWPDCVIHVPGHTLISGDVHGWTESLKWLARFFERGGKTFSEEILAVVADDNWAFMLTNCHAERMGRRIEDKSANVTAFETAGLPRSGLSSARARYSTRFSASRIEGAAYVATVRNAAPRAPESPNRG